MIRFDGVRLQEFLEAELSNRQVVQESIRHVVASLIQTSLRGVDSHGINLFPHYCRAAAVERVNPRPNIQCERTGSSTARVDADHAFGHHAGAVAMEEAIALAKRTGIGAVSVSKSTHFGAAAYFGLMAAESDCLGIAFTNADALVKAFGAKEAFFGTNPVCFTAPMADEGPFCLDMATSLVSWNKVGNFRRENRDLPSHWAFDSDGRSVTDPNAARSLSPAGGYKGYGLGMMVEICCALLGDGPIGKDIQPMYALPLDNAKRCLSHFFMAIDISRFVEPTIFKNVLQKMANRIRSLEPSDDVGKVMVAGDPEKISFVARTRDGIPIDEGKYDEFMAINANFSRALIA